METNEEEDGRDEHPTSEPEPVDRETKRSLKKSVRWPAHLANVLSQPSESVAEPNQHYISTRNGITQRNMESPIWNDADFDQTDKHQSESRPERVQQSDPRRPSLNPFQQAVS